MNKHDDHDASCLCCKHLAWDSGFPGSEVTPADGGYYTCAKKHFDYAWPDMHENMHREMRRALTCEDFEPRAK